VNEFRISFAVLIAVLLPILLNLVLVSNMSSAQYYGGIEGGATHSKLVICDKNGSIISKVSGLGTNHWVVGIPEVARRVAEMVKRAKQDANIEQKTKLQSLGLSLSGCEQEATNKTLKNELLKNHPDIADSYYVCSDTVGSLLTASPLGGLVLIAGTGSNALLQNPDGKCYSCGGWGNFLADEGSAWWISHKAMKTVFDDIDNLNKSPYDITTVWETIKSYFNVQTRYDLLDHCYAKFEKAHFAGLCAHLAEAGRNGDPLCIHLFEEAGRYLAKATLALLPKVSDKLVFNGDFSIVCVGSVWKSWDLLKSGYSKEIVKGEYPFGLNLLQLTQAMAIGAAYIAADSIKYNLPRNYSNNYEIFHYYPRTKKVDGLTAQCKATNGASNGVYQNGKSNGVHTNGTTTTSN